MQRAIKALLAPIVILFGASAAGEEPVDYDTVNRIIDQATNQSEVIDLLQHMTDVIGPRLTGSPGMERANQWAKAKFEDWGLENARHESFEFGKGWSFEKSFVRMLEPRLTQLHALPRGWTPGTNGVLTGSAIKAKIESEKDFDEYRGKLAGKILFISDPMEIGVEPNPNPFVRRSDEMLKQMEPYDLTEPGSPSAFRARFRRLQEFRPKFWEFVVEEGAVAVIDISSRQGGLIRTGGRGYRDGETASLPYLTMSTEDYGRTLRLLELDHEVTLELEVETTFYTDHTTENYTLAEIPGRGRNPEVVMAGAHFDSWFVGDGAVDNGAGSSVVMEAARILSTLDIEPKRTIRFALWSGEEQGLMASRDYVRDFVATRPIDPTDTRENLPDFARTQGWPITPLGEYEKLSGYFNLDNGSGKIRGIYGQGNVALQPIFKAWFQPFHNMGAQTVTLDRTGGTDHLAFQAVGIPGFQFIQDPLDYGARLHHTHIDRLDHVQPDDLRQASAIMASFLYHAAMRDEMLPRKPLPTESKNAREAREKRQAEEVAKAAEENSQQ